jgi:predicted ribosomally synthesized peptide with nif11-like leader
MSVKNVKAFFERVEGDKVLQVKLKVVAENRNTQEAVGDLVKIAAEVGFRFTTADYAEARKQAAEGLSEAELKAVTAGVRDCPFGYKCGLLIRF